MKHISLPPIKKIFLFGGGDLMLEFCLWASRKFYCRIYTSNRHAYESISLDGMLFIDKANKLNLDVEIVDDINEHYALFGEIDHNSIGLGFGEAWKFNEEILNLFDGKLFDFMGIPLPKYRGGAHYTWAILRNEKEWGCHIQQVNSDTVQGWFDSGYIVASHDYSIDVKKLSPQDLFDYCAKVELHFLKKFCIGLSTENKLNLLPVDNLSSLFFPRLNSAKNGWLDWRWSGEDIESFINAFSYPYTGASTRLDGKHVFLMNAVLEHENEKFHPYQSGIVTRVNDKGIWVVSSSGLLTITKVVDISGKDITSNIFVGSRFFTEDVDIKKSMTYMPNYDTRGDTNSLKGGYNNKECIHGEQIYLRPIVEGDCTQQYVDWLNNPDINQFLEVRWEEQDMHSVRNYVEKIINSHSDSLYAIMLRSNLKHIGNIKLGDINNNHKTAEVSYFIGDKSCWGKGFATDAVRLIVEHGVKELGLKFIFAGVYDSNISSKKVLEKVGFELQGCLKNKIVNNKGDREDHLFYGYVYE